jgi:hypothetical protein
MILRTSAAGPPLFEVNRPSAEALAALQSHPRFPEAMRIIAAGLVALYGGNRMFNVVVTDRGRYLMSVLALHLHLSSQPGDPRSGLTVSRLRSLCAEHRICSPGRAETMLVLMRLFGHLTPVPSETDRRLRRLVPSESLIAWHRARCAFIFEAMAKLLPEGAEASAALASPDFLPRFIRHLAESYLQGYYYVDLIPDVRLFYERNAGVAILMRLILAGEPDDAFPPRRPVTISLSALGRSFGVSRIHVRRLLQDCVGEGFLERTADREGLRVLPRLAEAVRGVIAVYLAHNAHCARAALAEPTCQSAVDWPTLHDVI